MRLTGSFHQQLFNESSSGVHENINDNESLKDILVINECNSDELEVDDDLLEADCMNQIAC